MKLLAIDTSSPACSVALTDGDQVHARDELKPREHTRLLMPMLREVLDAGSVPLAELDAIILGNGPGSFIGMRIAASVAQGLAHGAGVDIVPVSSLAAVAAEVFARSDALEVAVAQDAHMSEVYLGVYRRDADNLPELLFPERLHGHMPIEELDETGAGTRVAGGAGWSRYPQLMALNEALFSGEADILHPRAEYLLGIGVRAFRSGLGVSPADVAPAYLRHKVAERPSPDRP